MTPARRGSVTGATWLIGLGVVLLIRESMGWTWSQAWPLFVILIGVASFISRLLDWRPGVAGIWSFTWPVVWIVVGIVLLMSTTGQLGQGPGELIDTYWPWAAVIIGIWFLIGAFLPFGRGPTNQLVLPLSGAPDANIKIQFGAGTLTARPAAPGNLVDGSFEGGVRHRIIGPNRIELEQDTTYGLPWVDHGSGWDVGLTGEVPLDLRLDTGANKATLDLGGLRLRSLELHTGASDTRVLLPRAAGATTVHAESGAASLTIEIPAGVAARIRNRMTLGSTKIDESRFPKVGENYFESPDYAASANRVDIDVSGGVGSVKIVGGAAETV
jgi:hypothetical protein